VKKFFHSNWFLSKFPSQALKPFPSKVMPSKLTTVIIWILLTHASPDTNPYPCEVSHVTFCHRTSLQRRRNFEKTFRTLEAELASVEHELIFVNDGSRDHTREILEQLLRKPPAIILSISAAISVIRPHSVQD
jgi:cellulose synthase/poly-beta-1,6-N-acetylglucosamine synthase-like glycosyltransferase